ncbi:Exu regulon transcriptional regulator [Lentibacillus sp. JNUCC-1]|uniref:GntR family transcriptional regulator n=1 Tax=Lentibacillus sp. JNUCC-1 TaxID=2654513 RepID=UPI0012E920C0|nr:GntR family transcriptional regulator [Lentibacillus sp. JNUCC-1]MUV36969.1 Exu regulon transcriptional regulator [Lentibacillus sp. JNUCC-1]
MEIEKPLSLPERIHKKIAGLIKAGEFEVGDKLPSEINLAKQLKVSRTALRDALQLLEFDGYVERRHGVGTYVLSNTPTLQAGLEKLESITEFLKAKDLNPGTLEGTVTEVRADQHVANQLNVKEGVAVIKLERVRIADGRPISYDIAYGMPDVINEDFIQNQDKESIFDYLESGKDTFISHSYCNIYAKNATPELAEKLNVPVSEALQVLEQVYYTKQNKTVYYGESYIRSDVLKFHLIRRR